ncbi:helix-turn-helix domain-containing protein [Allostreptomyces psammosilenae]|uniref:Transcriptional regulator with XRE-family HTH domain n=1 Tax=Allostreptomyces psammosilenae TaxID=1892865 RepID=A0A853A5S3_9ACTN|nr:helix-turn-helix transcriptional regulator [Allostreptomyces psammosilenae]NYI05878.1 transcriptional regulator with XRE-family HTH domain [Allostreptomyces psammosilenae]
MDAPSSDTEAFAERLRELKDRTGRSYGALARRLHVSASTLHRYCHGEAVPTEFAPVERFARLCGADPEELVGLHRRWILADEERRRSQGREGPGKEEGREPVERAQRSSGADVEIEVEVEDEAGTGAGPGAEPTEPATGGEGERQEEGSDGERAAGPAGPTGPAPRAIRPGRRWRPRAARWAVAAVAAGTLLAPLAVDAVSRQSSSAAPQRPSASSSTASTGPGEAVAPPFGWDVQSHVWEANCDHAYLLDAPPERVPAPPDEQHAAAWAAERGAVHAGETQVRVTVQGTTSAAVVIQAVRVHVVERGDGLAPDAAAAGNWGVYEMSSGCGGALTPRFFEVDLESPRPVVRPRPGGTEAGPIPAVSLPLRVSADDPEVLLIKARAVDCDCSWYLELEWTSLGGSGTLRIDDAGTPFRTSGARGLPVYGYDWAAGRWTEGG